MELTNPSAQRKVLKVNVPLDKRDGTDASKLRHKASEMMHNLEEKRDWENARKERLLQEEQERREEEEAILADASNKAEEKRGFFRHRARSSFNKGAPIPEVVQAKKRFPIDSDEEN